MITANGFRRDWVNAIFRLFTSQSLLCWKKAEILSQHITGVQNEFNLLLSVDTLSSSVKTLPQTSKGQDNDGGNDDDSGGSGDDDKDGNGSQEDDNGSGADDDEGVGSDDKSDDGALSESGGNDDEGGEITWCQHFRSKIVTLTNKV